jgi:PAS domain S-box-containing protein
MHKRTQAVLERMTDAFVAVDRQWHYTYVNERALARMRSRIGKPLERSDVLGMNMWELFPEVVDGEFYRRYHQAMREQRVLEFEARHSDTDEWLEVRLYPSPDLLSIYWREVTTRGRAVRQLAHHAHLLENMDDAVLATDVEFVLNVWNKGAERMFGWTAAEALGRRAYELIPTERTEPELAERLQVLGETGRLRHEGVWYGKHRRPVHAEALIVAQRAPDERVTGYLCLLRDVADRHRARAELEARARQQAVVADLGLRALRSDDLDALMAEAAAVVARALGVELVAIADTLPGQELSWRASFGWRMDASGPGRSCPDARNSLEGYTLDAGGPVVAEDVLADERFRPPTQFAAHDPVSAVSVPITGQENPVGVLSAAAKTVRAFGADDINFLQAVANVLASAVERSRVEKQLHEVREEERSRIARDLHDEALSELTTALALASRAQRRNGLPQGSDPLPDVTAALKRAGRRLRSAIYDLRLTANEDKALPDLLEELVALHAAMTPGVIRLRRKDALPATSLGHRGTEVLRIVGEALTNARRHSAARSIWVDATGSSSSLVHIEVADDGQWPELAGGEPYRRGAGLSGMFERAALLDIDIQISARAQGGTVVSLTLGLDEGRTTSTESRVLLVEDHAAARVR